MPDLRSPRAPGRSVGRRAASLAAGATLLALPAILAAQTPATPAPPATPADSTLASLELGTRVRLTLQTYRELRVAGRIDSVLASAVVLDTAERRGFLFLAPGPELLPQYRQVRVRYDDIDAVEVSRGHSRWQGATRWGIIGALVGGALTGLSGSPEYNPNSGDFLEAAVSGAIAGGLVGGTVGYFTGREIWVRLR